MSASILDRPLKAYRIGAASNRYPIFDGTGSVLFPGRWNSSRSQIIYCSEHYSTALLEKLVHFNTGKMPTNQHWIEITIPVGTEYEIVTNYSLPGWNEPSQKVSQAYGDSWLLEKRSAILVVPSIVAPVENNILVNEFHPQFSTLTTSINQPVIWDRHKCEERLCRQSHDRSQWGVLAANTSIDSLILGFAPPEKHLGAPFL